jgi:hypothetical protein
MGATGLCLTAMVFVPLCWGTSAGWVSVDNQTYDTVYLGRVGDPSTSVLVPKRMIGQLQVPLVGQGVPALEALQVSFPGGIVLPETEFRGFDGQYGQPVSLVIVSPQNVAIKYDQAGVTSSPATNNPDSTGTGPASEAFSGGGTGYGVGYGSPNYLRRSPSPGATPGEPKDYSSLAKTPEPTKKRLLLPQSAGAKVRVVTADSRYKFLDAPAPIRSQQPETAKAATAAAAEPQAEEKKGGWGSLITWIIVCVALVGFIAWKRLSSK